MADTREIVVKLYDDTGGSSSETPKTLPQQDEERRKKANEDLSKLLSRIAHPINTLESDILGKNLWARNVYESAKGLVTQMVDVNVTRYFKLNEDYIGEQNWQNAKQALNSFSSLVGTVASSAVIGAKYGGGFGAAAGAAIGIASYTMSSVLNTNNERANYYQSFNATLMQTDFDARRMSLIDNGRGTDN